MQLQYIVISVCCIFLLNTIAKKTEQFATAFNSLGYINQNKRNLDPLKGYYESKIQNDRNFSYCDRPLFAHYNIDCAKLYPEKDGTNPMLVTCQKIKQIADPIDQSVNDTRIHTNRYRRYGINRNKVFCSAYDDLEDKIIKVNKQIKALESASEAVANQEKKDLKRIANLTSKNLFYDKKIKENKLEFKSSEQQKSISYTDDMYSLVLFMLNILLFAGILILLSKLF